MVLLVLLDAGSEFTWYYFFVRCWSRVYMVLLVLLDAGPEFTQYHLFC